MQDDVERSRVGRFGNIIARRDAAHVDGPVQRVESGPKTIELLDSAKIHSGVVMRAHQPHAFGGDETLELFHAARRHSGNIHRYLFESQQRALAAPVADSVRDFRAAAKSGGGADLVDPVASDQIADVRNNPRGAGLDKFVRVELLQIVLDERQLLRKHGHESLQGRAGLLVARPIDGRQQRVELVGSQTHEDFTRFACDAGSRVSSSAPCGSGAVAPVSSPLIGEAAPRTCGRSKVAA